MGFMGILAIPGEFLAYIRLSGANSGWMGVMVLLTGKDNKHYINSSSIMSCSAKKRKSENFRAGCRAGFAFKDFCNLDNNQ